jgi:hypothetical protein
MGCITYGSNTPMKQKHQGDTVAMTTPCRYRSLGLGTMMALTGAFLVGAEFAAPTPAQARGELPIMLQITNNTTGDIERPRLRMREGLTLTFVSDGDVMGLGSEPGHREVYYHDVLAGTTVRVTNTAVGESYYASRQTDDIFSNGRPDYIVFTSTGEHGAVHQRVPPAHIHGGRRGQ